MSRYEVRKSITSCHVTIELLRELECYIYKTTKELSANEDDLNFTVALEDEYGEETLSSVQDYKRSKIPNNVHTIKLRASNYRENLCVEVSFSEKQNYSYIRIEIDGEGAKEKAHGILSTVSEHVKEHKNLNFIFYGGHNYVLPMIVGGVFGGSIDILSGNDLSTYNFYSLVLLVSILTYGLFKLFSPYSELDTKKNENVQKSIKWCLNGLAGVFIFGVLAYYLRNLVIGF